MSAPQTKVRIGVILSSMRQGRRGEGFAKWIHQLVAERPGVDAEILDLKDYPLPGYAYAEMPSALETKYEAEAARRWSEKVHAMDGFVIVTPEYNHGYPGQLKNALDHVSKGWWYKPVGFVGYGGTASGARAVAQLKTVSVELRMVPVRGEVDIRLIGLDLDESHRPKDPLYARTSKAMIDQLVWWTVAAKNSRAAVTPPDM
jgi:NAD(P)H-dependent FMN reductase